MKQKKIALILGIVFLILFFFLPDFAQTRSDLALAIQRQLFARKSVFYTKALDLKIPTDSKSQDQAWCDKMKLYHPKGAFFDGDPKGEMSILYNFGNFQNGRSIFYDSQSDYFNAHYGVYAVALKGQRFGWLSDGNIDEQALKDLVAFDYLDLVMNSLGCPPAKGFFKSVIIDIKENQELSGFSDWVEIDALIQANAPLHQKKEIRLGYLQYGSPPPNYQGDDFPVVKMHGKLFMRYDQERELTVIYFVMARTEKMIEETSDDYLKTIDYSK